MDKDSACVLIACNLRFRSTHPNLDLSGGIAMVAAVLLCAGLLAADAPPTKAPSAEDIEAYQAAKVRAGRDADAHVRLALWCEAHGMEAERLEQLALAVLADPSHAAARGLLGWVRDGQTW